MSTLSLTPDAERRSQLLQSLSLSRATPAGSAASVPASAAPAAAVPTAAAPASRRLPRWAAALLVVNALGLAALGAQGLNLDALPWGLTPAQARPAPSVADVPVALPAAAPAAQFEASGFIAATRTATVSSRVMGQVSAVLVEEGAHVKRGQVLARIADDQARTELQLAQAQQDAARARLGAATAHLQEARREFGREQSLRDQNFTSEARLGKSATAVDVAASTVHSAQADLSLTALQVRRQAQVIDDHVVRAPFDGVVLARNAQVGEIVAPGGAGGGYTRTGIYTIVDMRSLEIVVDVNEDLLNRLQPGQKVQAELYADKGRSVAGEVLRVMPSADRAKSTVRVRVKLLDDDPRILPDMAVKVLFL